MEELLNALDILQRTCEMVGEQQYCDSCPLYDKEETDGSTCLLIKPDDYDIAAACKRAIGRLKRE
ncbi:MAG: hypothetical protein K2M46_10595 [Lachnospiraceae bacterium]|nr:hypothetical protein [Lachnospiraceae bacterium]